ncbi:MAG: M23 family metallopeptidase [Chloroflexi bacterium]|nr:M23 family metallopeptidase [Chloroflexota bacterium]
MKKLTALINWLRHPRYRLFKISLGSIIAIVTLYPVYQTVSIMRSLNDPRSQSFVQWATGDSAAREDMITVQRDACPDAPFILPTDGFIGLLYEDPRGPYSGSNPHQGIDIFSNTTAGETAVYAAHDGYITRDSNWRSALIQRIPNDPLNPGNQIWLYYAHMADKGGNSFIVDAFPPGTQEQFVEQGTLLGYTGDYNGNSVRTIWVHLHFSIVKDDGNGRYLNELQFANTLDPTPYLGMWLNYKDEGGNGSRCKG